MVWIRNRGLRFSNCLGIHHVDGLELSLLRKQNHADPKLVYPLEVQPWFFIGLVSDFHHFSSKGWWQRLPGYIYLACFSSRSTYLSQDMWEAGVSLFIAQFPIYIPPAPRCSSIFGDIDNSYHRAYISILGHSMHTCIFSYVSPSKNREAASL